MTQFSKKMNIFDILGICIHDWKFVRIEKGNIKDIYRVMDILECKKCGNRKSVRVW